MRGRVLRASSQTRVCADRYRMGDGSDTSGGKAAGRRSQARRERTA